MNELQDLQSPKKESYPTHELSEEELSSEYSVDLTYESNKVVSKLQNQKSKMKILEIDEHL